MRAFLRRINYVLATVSGLLFVMATVITVYDAIARYAFNSPTLWAKEITGYIILTAIFIPVAYTLQEKGYVWVDFLLERLSKQKRRVLGFLTSILGLAFNGAWAWLLWEAVLAGYKHHAKSPTLLGVYLVPFYMVMALAISLLFLQYVTHFLPSRKTET